ncbi:MAG: PIN domain nuclease [Bacteroidales bacterium]|nr:PIN domain nuclease [Bacteroidales bacterium]
MVMVDTSVWIDYFNGQHNVYTDYLDALLAEDFVVTGDIILAEILQGFREDTHFEKAKEALDNLKCFPLTNKKLAIQSAMNFRILRKKGKTVRKTTGILIGTFCIENQISLLFNDRDFDPMVEHLGLIPAILKS